VLLDGAPVRPTVRAMIARGVAYLPEDRDRQGLITSASIRENIVLPILGRLARLGLTRPARERRVAEERAERLEVKAVGVDQVTAALSGGNRQKVAIAKWLATDPTVLILDEPTHGIDVGTKAQVHRVIERLAQRGLAVLLISSDLPEILALSDRVLVVAEGRIVSELRREEATQEAVMLAATAHVPSAAGS
jgi:rhamnose transport system ATP-binding protein